MWARGLPGAFAGVDHLLRGAGGVRWGESRVHREAGLKHQWPGGVSSAEAVLV